MTIELILASTARKNQTSLQNEKIQEAFAEINKKINDTITNKDDQYITFYSNKGEQFLRALIPHLEKAEYKVSLHRPPVDCRDPREMSTNYLTIRW